MAYRDGPLQDIKLPLTWAAVVATAVAVVVTLALLFGGHREGDASGGYAAVRGGFARVLEPVEAGVAAPVRWGGAIVDYVGGYFFAISDNRRLRAELRDMQGWRDTALALKDVNDRYEALLKLKTEPPIPMVTGRAITDARGPFSNARLIDVGGASGVKVGDPAMGERGVVGRVVGTAPDVSRLLLLTDVESRTPVLVDRTNGRAILTGDGSAYPRLEYVRGRDPVKTGDMLLTSGDGGVFPRGLPVGVAVRDLRGVWRVRLYSDQAPIDFVRVLLFQDFTQGTQAPSLTGAAAPPLLPSEAADRAESLAKSAPRPAPPAATAATPQRQPARGQPASQPNSPGAPP